MQNCSAVHNPKFECIFTLVGKTENKILGTSLYLIVTRNTVLGISVRLWGTGTVGVVCVGRESHERENSLLHTKTATCQSS